MFQWLRGGGNTWRRRNPRGSAAGAASPGLVRGLGVTVPVAPERGYHIELPDPRVDLRVPVTDADGKFVAAPMEGGIRFAGTSEFRRADAPPNWGRAA